MKLLLFTNRKSCRSEQFCILQNGIRLFVNLQLKFQSIKEIIFYSIGEVGKNLGNSVSRGR